MKVIFIINRVNKSLSEIILRLLVIFINILNEIIIYLLINKVSLFLEIVYL